MTNPNTVEQKLRIPIGELLTIGQLAEEVSKQAQAITGGGPLAVYRIESSDGCVLAADYAIKAVLDPEETSVVAVQTGFKSVSLVEAYAEMCSEMNVCILPKIRNALQNAERSSDEHNRHCARGSVELLSCSFFRSEDFKPLFRTLRERCPISSGQISIFRLCGCSLNDEGELIALLAGALRAMTSLTTLQLKRIGLDAKGLSVMVDQYGRSGVDATGVPWASSFRQQHSSSNRFPGLSCLMDLDLSCNRLCGTSGPSTSTFIAVSANTECSTSLYSFLLLCPRLRILTLQDINATESYFEAWHAAGVDLRHLEHLTTVKLDANHGLGGSGVGSFLRLVCPSRIEELTLDSVKPPRSNNLSGQYGIATNDPARLAATTSASETTTLCDSLLAYATGAGTQMVIPVNTCRLQSLSLASNGIDSGCLGSLRKMVTAMPLLQRLDLQGNADLGLCAVLQLLELSVKHECLTQLNLSGTGLMWSRDSGLRDTIGRALGADDVIQCTAPLTHLELSFENGCVPAVRSELEADMRAISAQLWQRVYPMGSLMELAGSRFMFKANCSDMGTE